MDQPQRIYSNRAAMHGGAFDVQIDFGYRRGDADPETLVQVVMSWQHAQAVVALLQEQINNYQREIGPLPDIEVARTTPEEEAE